MGDFLPRPLCWYRAWRNLWVIAMLVYNYTARVREATPFWLRHRSHQRRYNLIVWQAILELFVPRRGDTRLPVTILPPNEELLWWGSKFTSLLDRRQQGLTCRDRVAYSRYLITDGLRLHHHHLLHWSLLNRAFVLYFTCSANHYLLWGCSTNQVDFATSLPLRYHVLVFCKFLNQSALLSLLMYARLSWEYHLLVNVDIRRWCSVVRSAWRYQRLAEHLEYIRLLPLSLLLNLQPLYVTRLVK